MKTYTFFMTGKALAIVVAALTASGGVTFLMGLFIGVKLNLPPADARSPNTVAPTATVADAGVARDRTPSGGDDPQAASGNAAAWPFIAEPAPAGPVPAEEAPGAAPATPGSGNDSVATKRPADAMGGVKGVQGVADTETDVLDVRSLVGTRGRDVARYAVQVGSFRVERNARDLAARLQRAGYSPSVLVKAEMERDLFVVRVGRFVGRDAAELAAERIGDDERLVAAIVAVGNR